MQFTMIEKKIEKAEALSDIKRYAEAVKILLSCYAEEPDNLRLLSGLSVALSRLNDSEKALKYAREAVRHHPDAAESHLLLANIYITLKNYSEALIYARKSLKIEPGNIIGLHTAFISYFYSGDSENARQILPIMEKLAPASDLTLCSRGLLNLEDKHFDAAEKSFRQVLRIDPENETAMHNLAIVLLKNAPVKKEVKPTGNKSGGTYAEINLFTFEQQKQSIEHFFMAARLAPSGEAADSIKAFVRFPPLFSFILFCLFLSLTLLLDVSAGITVCFGILDLFFLTNILVDLQRYAVYLKLKRSVAPEIREILRVGEREYFSFTEILRNGSVETFSPILRLVEFAENSPLPIFRWLIKLVLLIIMLFLLGGALRLIEWIIAVIIG